MKYLVKITTFVFILTLILSPVNNIEAVTSLKGVSLEVTPKTTNSLADWTISFQIPEKTKLGHILISLAGFTPDLSHASLTVTGLPQGTIKLGKTNPACVSNCDDIRYYFSDTVNVIANTNIVFNLSNVKNSSKIGRSGVNAISIFSSKYPQMDLAFSASDYFVQLIEGDEPAEPDDESNSLQAKDIKEVLINELFYQSSSKTTKLSAIEDSSKVSDLTFDLIDKVKVVFKEPVDLSGEEAIHFIANLADYMTLDYYYFWVAPELIKFFKVPLEITYYNLPYVWEPNIVKDGAYILEENEIESYSSVVVDGKPQISFEVRETGSYNIVPKLDLYIQDNQKVVSAQSTQTFTGRISDPNAKLFFRLNNEDLSIQPEIDKKTGEYSFSLDLEQGSNLIEVEAVSEYAKVPKINKIVQYSTGETHQVDTRSDAFNPIYYIIIALGVLALFLAGAIIYLMKTKK